jgi:hypothetical protein
MQNASPDRLNKKSNPETVHGVKQAAGADEQAFQKSRIHRT